MKKYYYVIFILVIATFLYFYLNNHKDKEICFEKNCFEVEIADDFSERARGLMFRERLDEDKGMLFIFEDSGLYPFWMKDTVLPLDIIWMDSNFQVVYIAKNTTPYSLEPINPGIESKYVLEINGGLSEQLKIEKSSVAMTKNI